VIPNLPALLHDAVFTAGATTLLYTATVTTVVLTALLARTPTRRRIAQEVLKILLRRHDERR
jgi:hypothetical protein